MTRAGTTKVAGMQTSDTGKVSRGSAMVTRSKGTTSTGKLRVMGFTIGRTETTTKVNGKAGRSKAKESGVVHKATAMRVSGKMIWPMARACTSGQMVTGMKACGDTVRGMVTARTLSLMENNIKATTLTAKPTGKDNTSGLMATHTRVFLFKVRYRVKVCGTSRHNLLPTDTRVTTTTD